MPYVRQAVSVYDRVFCLKLQNLLRPFKPPPPIPESGSSTRLEILFVSQRLFLYTGLPQVSVKQAVCGPKKSGSRDSKFC
eukprot:s1922_g10.t1